MWYQLKIHKCLHDEVEEVSEYLEELGALSIELTDNQDNPVLEPEPGTTPLWPEVVIIALFAQPKDAQNAKDQVLQFKPKLTSEIITLVDKDWERAWMEDYKPMQFGSRVWICPTTHNPPEPDAINIILDPGLAFGTGTHPTTALCLTWLDKAPIEDKSIIDFGCGSGILALAALKLGAARVDAVDIDKQALQATADNSMTNDIDTRKLHILYPDALKETTDIIIANILLAPLTTLATRFHDLLNKNGLLVVSGILSDQVPLLERAYQDKFTKLEEHHLNEWALLVFSRN